MKKTRYCVWLQVKPYVKKFLITNFNRPDADWPVLIDLSADKSLQQSFISRLCKEGRWENRYDTLFRYSEQVPIEISRDTFNRYGWSMSNTETVHFGVQIERRIKLMMYTFIDTYVHSLGMTITASVRAFQNSFGFDEDSWSYDTIRREYTRHQSKSHIHDRQQLDKTIFLKINQIILGNLSDFGTISHQGKIAYENINQ